MTTHIRSFKLATARLHFRYRYTHDLTSPFGNTICLHDALVVDCWRFVRDRFAKHDLPGDSLISGKLIDLGHLLDKSSSLDTGMGRSAFTEHLQWVFTLMSILPCLIVRYVSG